MLLISHHSTSIREVIYDVAAIVAPKVKEKELNLLVSISPDTPYKVLVDDHRLRQTLMNFMSNAVKFTQSGSIEIAVETKSLSPQQVNLEFSVRDTGIGIDSHKQQQIFKPFAQEDDSTTRQFGGTGLGLAISTQLVEMMGGKIQLESEKNVGSRFFFNLQLEVEQLDFSAAHTPQTDICLIGSDSANRQRIRQELEFFHQVIAAEFDHLKDYVEHTPPGAHTTVLVESETEPVSLYEDQLKHLSHQHHLCIVRQFSSQAHAFDGDFQSIVTLPLLGQRLLKAISSSCINQVNPEIHLVEEDNSKQRILVVEDNAVNRKIAGLHLSNAGIEFDIAHDGAEAVQMYTSHPELYSLILMDCMMPIMDGFEATKHIREFESKQAHQVPIIALTASVLAEDMDLCFEAGMNDYLAKPFKADVLLVKICEQIKVEPKLPELEHCPTSQVDFLHTELETGKVLLVEDNTVNQKVASLILEKAGYEYDIAENGQIAVDMYRHHQNYQVILMDCMMPVKDGFEATREIRRLEKKQGFTKTPIIALTASVVDDDIQRCYDSGMDAYLAKPVRKKLLIDTIENVV